MNITSPTKEDSSVVLAGVYNNLNRETLAKILSKKLEPGSSSFAQTIYKHLPEEILREYYAAYPSPVAAHYFRRVLRDEDASLADYLAESDNSLIEVAQFEIENAEGIFSILGSSECPNVGILINPQCRETGTAHLGSITMTLSPCAQFCVYHPTGFRRDGHKVITQAFQHACELCREYSIEYLVIDPSVPQMHPEEVTSFLEECDSQETQLVSLYGMSILSSPHCGNLSSEINKAAFSRGSSLENSQHHLLDHSGTNGVFSFKNFSLLLYSVHYFNRFLLEFILNWIQCRNDSRQKYVRT